MDAGRLSIRVYSKKVSDMLDESSPEIEFDFAMRYGNPSIKSGLESLKKG